jgi:DnaK suppressor protein
MTSQNCPADERTPVNPDRARELLTTELKELDDRAEFAASSAAESASGDLSANEAGTTQHPADFGTEVTNRMEGEGLVRTIELQRRRVQDALDRLDGGTYGRCAVCGTAIDDERLEARPEVATCREHADALPVG